jgi:cyclic pyranopterin phosphate synthase
MATKTRSRRLSHVDARGRIRMVDVSGKPPTAREAVARATIRMSALARRLVRSGQVAKGDPLQAARLCHPLPLTHVGVEITPTRTGFAIEARAATTAQTGVEMEALTAAAVAALAIYDMLKAVDPEMVIGDICLLEKRGGRSGEYVRSRRAPRASSRPRRQAPGRTRRRT